MSWAAGRETTRIEDSAYCLLGIFDVPPPGSASSHPLSSPYYTTDFRPLCYLPILGLPFLANSLASLLCPFSSNATPALPVPCFAATLSALFTSGLVDRTSSTSFCRVAILTAMASHLPNIWLVARLHLPPRMGLTACFPTKPTYLLSLFPIIVVLML